MTGEILKQEIITELKQYLPTERILEQEPMSRHTTFRVGGPARLFLEIATQEELKSTIQLLNDAGETYYLLGNGSNLLVSDKGYDGIILHLAKEFNHIEIKDNHIMYCEAGATLAAIARVALAQSLTGFEFAAGIPGTLGGAVVMNAGAYDGEMKQVITSVRLMTPQGEIVEKSCEEMHFAYRHSLLKEEAYIVFKDNVKIHKLEKIENKKVSSKKEKIDGKKYAIKEAEMIVEDYISKIEKKEYEIGIGSKKIREKYKRLKALTIFLTIFSALSLWSILLR